jgi:mono/diheme cytochrome c family protein
LEKLAKIGVTPPFPGYDGGSAFSFRQAYVPPLQGQTAYGYSQQIVADLYQPVDVNAAIQAMALAGKWSQEATREAGNNLAGVTAQVVAGNERVALAREDTRRVIETIRESRPPNRITTTITGSGQGPAFPAVPPKEGPAAEPNAAVSVASTSCINCHGGAKPGGGFDMTKAPTDEQVRKMAYRMSLPAGDPKLMPQGVDGKPAKPLTPAQMANVINEAAKAITPKP